VASDRAKNKRKEVLRQTDLLKKKLPIYNISNIGFIQKYEKACICTTTDSREGSVELSMSKNITASIDIHVVKCEALTTVEGSRICKAKQELFSLNSEREEWGFEIKINPRNTVSCIGPITAVEQLDFDVSGACCNNNNALILN
jgi:hypothetical protein